MNPWLPQYFASMALSRFLYLTYLSPRGNIWWPTTERPAQFLPTGRSLHQDASSSCPSCNHDYQQNRQRKPSTKSFTSPGPREELLLLRRSGHGDRWILGCKSSWARRLRLCPPRSPPWGKRSCSEAVEVGKWAGRAGVSGRSRNHQPCPSQASGLPGRLLHGRGQEAPCIRVCPKQYLGVPPAW